VNYGGQVAQASSTSSTEAIGVVVAFLVLLIGFGSVIAAGIPLIGAIVGVVVTELALMALTAVVSESSTTSILAVMIGLAGRYRLFAADHEPQPARDWPKVSSLRRPRRGPWPPRARCGVFAGLTVLIALAALAVVNIPFLTTMALPLRALSLWPSRSP